MIPSRGLRWSSQTIGIGRRRVETCSARQFSSLPAHHGKPNTLLTKTRASVASTNAFPSSRTNTLIRNGAAIRFASTSPFAAARTTPTASSTTSTPTPTSPATSTPLEESSFQSDSFISSLDSATDFSSESLYNIPEHIGYLKSLGLDYGYGPTAVMEWTLEHVHIFAGTPWWLSISLTAILIRVILFKPYMNAAENASRMKVIQPITKPIQDKMTAAMRASNSDQVMQLRNELKIINARAGIKMWKSFVPMLQVFAGYGTFVLLRAMAAMPVPGLETGGFLWVYNLSVPDPFWVMPLATAGVMHWVLRKGGDTGVTNLTPAVASAIAWVLPGLTIIFTGWLPAAVQVSFFVSAIMSYIQSTLFRQDWFRSYFNMTPLKPISTGASTPTSTYKGNLKIAPPRPLSQSELNSRFQNAALKPETKPGMIGGIKDTWAGLKEQKVDKQKDNAAKNEVKQAKKYEIKRREEIKMERLQREADRRAEKAAKTMKKR